MSTALLANAVVLPSYHGKTTICRILNQVYDAEEFVLVKNSQVDSSLSSVGRESERGLVEERWKADAKRAFPADARVVLFPSYYLASAYGAKSILTLVLPEELLASELESRSDTQAMISGVLLQVRREAEYGREVLHLKDRGSVVNCVRALKMLSYSLLPESHYLRKWTLLPRALGVYSGMSTNSGKKAIGCREQVERAINSVILAADFEKLAFDEQRTSWECRPDYECVAGMGCSCSIAENGLIDPSFCAISHQVASLPIVNRWFHSTIDLMVGVSYCKAWSGWAAPSVVKLLGRWPTCRSVSSLWSASHASTKHSTGHILICVSVPDERTYLVSLVNVPYAQGKIGFLKLLADLPENARFD